MRHIGGFLPNPWMLFLPPFELHLSSSGFCLLASAFWLLASDFWLLTSGFYPHAFISAASYCTLMSSLVRINFWYASYMRCAAIMSTSSLIV